MSLSDPSAQSSSSPIDRPLRFFLHEPGWRIGLKVGSEREFCYMVAPGEEHYHRIGSGELYVFNSDERLCFACAQRRGVLTHEPKGLRQPIATFILAGQPGYDILELEDFQTFE